ncbi:hypothetical protein B0H13DRAFT_2326749 [Mycena leptocephala]|nr:hypothetical protein B0H13DRAFT_2326749 [Mycena leptocephala]
MSAYKSFAVVGGGTIGLPITEALAVTASSTKPAVPPSVEVIQVDYNDTTATAAIFKQHKVDVVISTVNILGLMAQKSLVDAAKLAAVKLFVPSEFGSPTDGQPEGVDNPLGGIGAKNKIAAYLKSVNIPSLEFLRAFSSKLFHGLSGIRNTGKSESPAKENASILHLHRRYCRVCFIHLDYPSPHELEDRVFRLEGERASFNDIGAQFKTSVEHVDRITGEAGDVKTGLFRILESGAGSTGWDEVNKTERSGSETAGSANALWPGHQWRSIKDVHDL